jgi:hypothetical protein
MLNLLLHEKGINAKFELICKSLQNSAKNNSNLAQNLKRSWNQARCHLPFSSTRARIRLLASRHIADHQAPPARRRTDLVEWVPGGLPARGSRSFCGGGDEGGGVGGAREVRGGRGPEVRVLGLGFGQTLAAGAPWRRTGRTRRSSSTRRPRHRRAASRRR